MNKVQKIADTICSNDACHVVETKNPKIIYISIISLIEKKGKK